MGYPRYAFDLRFDDLRPGGRPTLDPSGAGPGEVPPDVDAPDPPVHSESALRDAEAQAHARGFAAGIEAGVEAGRAEGLAAAAATVEAEAAAALTALKGALRRIARHLGTVTAAVEADAAAVTAALVRRVAPGLIELDAGPAMERLAVEALRAARTSPVLDIRVKPEAVAPLERHLAGMACESGFAGRLSVAGDPALGRGAIRAEWAAGSLAHDPALTEAAVAALTEAAVAALADASIAALTDAAVAALTEAAVAALADAAAITTTAPADPTRARDGETSP